GAWADGAGAPARRARHTASTGMPWCHGGFAVTAHRLRWPGTTTRSTVGTGHFLGHPPYGTLVGMRHGRACHRVSGMECAPYAPPSLRGIPQVPHVSPTS